MMRPSQLIAALSFYVGICFLMPSSIEAFMVIPAAGGDSLQWKSLTTTTTLAGMAQPEVETKTKTKIKEKTKQKVEIKRKVRLDEPVQNRDEDFQDAPMYKLYLLSDDDYDQEHVISRLCAIVEDMDEDQASTVLEQALMNGKAMCGKYPFERAELFKEQLLRSDPMIFSDLEEENA